MFIEYFLVIIVYIFFFLCLWIGKKIFIILIIFKIFDILGPPRFLRKAVQGKLKKYIKQNTKFNKIKPKKKRNISINAPRRNIFSSIKIASFI